MDTKQPPQTPLGTDRSAATRLLDLLHVYAYQPDATFDFQQEHGVRVGSTTKLITIEVDAELWDELQFVNRSHLPAEAVGDRRAEYLETLARYLEAGHRMTTRLYSYGEALRIGIDLDDELFWDTNATLTRDKGAA